MGLFRRHVGRKLSAYAQGELPPREAEQVEEHLSICPACRAQLEEIAFGIQLAGKLPLASAPEAVWISVEEALDRARPAETGVSVPRRISWSLLSAAAAALVVAVAFGWYFGLRQRLHVTQAVSEPSEFEAVALEEHDRRLRGASNWGVETSEIARVKEWVRAGSGLSASIPEKRPSEDFGRLRVVGAKLVRAGGTAAAEIGYEVNSHPVTLLTAKLTELREAPREGRFSKKVIYRFDAKRGIKVLTWGSDGQAYVMVSSLPRFGQQGCFLCHTAPERRKLIDNMNPQPHRKF